MRSHNFLTLITRTLVGALALGAMAACAPTTALQISRADYVSALAPQRAQSVYVTGSDGSSLAVDVYLPARTSGGGLPTIVVSSRYGRRGEVSVHFPNEWTAHGYALVVFDSVGSGVSTGVRGSELSDTEIADVGVISRWATAQAWSNGAIVLMGLSYSADTADLGTTLGEPAIRAALIRSAESDPYRHLFFPGGAANAMMRDLWGAAVAGKDRSVTCLADAAACVGMDHIAPVDGDASYAAARAALREHLANARLDIDLLGITFADDPLPGRRQSLADLGTAARGDALRASGVPTQIWGSWLDAGTAKSALERYMLAPNVEVLITSASHGAYTGADPFLSQPQQPTPTVARQFEILRDFADRALDASAPQSKVRYAVLGADVWRQTEVWPPVGVAPQRFYLNKASSLQAAADAAEAVLRYPVDFSVTTGKANRWSANVGVIPDYSRWPEQNASLLRFTTAPFTEDFELAGAPRIELTMRSTHEDGVVFAYLALQRPDGELIYLTEGMLRLLHRRATDEAGSLQRTFRRADIEPMIPGEMARVSFDAFPVAARIGAGDRLVLLIAGADHDTFARYPSAGDPIWTLDVGGDDGSFIDLPLRPWVDGAAYETQGP